MLKRIAWRQTNSSQTRDEIERLCDLGYVPACLEGTALAFAGGEGKKARDLAKRACALEDDEGCSIFGIISLGLGEGRNAIALVEKSCNQKGGASCGVLGDLLQALGEGKKARGAFEKSCHGFQGSCDQLGVLEFQDGKRDIAVNRFRQACYTGDVLSCRLFEVAREAGKGVEKGACDKANSKGCEKVALLAILSGNVAQARKNFEIGCGGADGWSCLALARDRRRNADFKQSFELANKACTLGVGRGCLFAGQDSTSLMSQATQRLNMDLACAKNDMFVCYMADRKNARTWCGKGVKQACLEVATEKRSVDELRKLCREDGFDRACPLAGQLLLKSEDAIEAVQLLKKGCDNDDRTSCRILAMHGAPESHDNELLESMCERSDAVACSNLAYLQGKLNDQKNAVVNLKKSCLLGYFPACSYLAEGDLDAFSRPYVLRGHRQACFRGSMADCTRYDELRGRWGRDMADKQ